MVVVSLFSPSPGGRTVGVVREGAMGVEKPLLIIDDEGSCWLPWYPYPYPLLSFPFSLLVLRCVCRVLVVLLLPLRVRGKGGGGGERGVEEALVLHSPPE